MSLSANPLAERPDAADAAVSGGKFKIVPVPGP